MFSVGFEIFVSSTDRLYRTIECHHIIYRLISLPCDIQRSLMTDESLDDLMRQKLLGLVANH